MSSFVFRYSSLASCFFYLPNKVQQLILGFAISFNRYEPVVLCCSAGDNLSNPRPESLRCSCLRCGFTIGKLISTQTNKSVANLLE
jgi:hypothetical protein